jgi:hypothetical protein
VIDHDQAGDAVQLDGSREIIPKSRLPGRELWGDHADGGARDNELAELAAQTATEHVVPNWGHHARIDARQQHGIKYRAICRAHRTWDQEWGGGEAGEHATA